MWVCARSPTHPLTLTPSARVDPDGRTGYSSCVSGKEKDLRCLASLVRVTSATWVLVGLGDLEGVKESMPTVMNKIG